MSICPICGTAGCSPCPGPRVLRGDIKLVARGPDLVGYADMATPAGQADAEVPDDVHVPGENPAHPAGDLS